MPLLQINSVRVPTDFKFVLAGLLSKINRGVRMPVCLAGYARFSTDGRSDVDQFQYSRSNHDVYFHFGFDVGCGIRRLAGVISAVPVFASVDYEKTGS